MPGQAARARVSTKWLDEVLRQQRDARHKLVFGHHPVWAVNGYAGDYQRVIERENGRRFWDVLLRHDVLAYFCSHILAFDVQVQSGILQVCTAGAGTAHRMPPEQEYLHFVQAALDDNGDDTGLRYQTLDRRGEMREWLSWPWQLPPAASWAPFTPTAANSLPADCLQHSETATVVAWRERVALGLRPIQPISRRRCSAPGPKAALCPGSGSASAASISV